MDREAPGNLPEGAKLTLWTDNADEFKGRMKTIGSSAAIGLALVLIFLVLTLRPIVALWVAAGIATAYAGAFRFPALCWRVPEHAVHLRFPAGAGHRGG